jgi:hypothetical protein
MTLASVPVARFSRDDIRRLGDAERKTRGESPRRSTTTGYPSEIRSHTPHPLIKAGQLGHRGSGNQLLKLVRIYLVANLSGVDQDDPHASPVDRNLATEVIGFSTLSDPSALK